MGLEVCVLCGTIYDLTIYDLQQSFMQLGQQIIECVFKQLGIYHLTIYNLQGNPEGVIIIQARV